MDEQCILSSADDEMQKQKEFKGETHKSLDHCCKGCAHHNGDGQINLHSRDSYCLLSMRWIDAALEGTQ